MTGVATGLSQLDRAGRAALVASLAVLVGCTDLGGDPAPATSTSVASAPLAIDYAEYVDVALDVMEAYHWNRENIDWTEVRAETVETLSQSPTQAEAHSELSDAVRMFDTLHSAFVPPGAAASGSATPLQIPAGDRVGEIGYLELPPISSADIEEMRAYLTGAHAALADADTPGPACGWVVDLRDNTGGNIEPMLHSVSGLLGQGRVLTSETAGAQSWVEVAPDGDLVFGGEDGLDHLPESQLIERITWSGEEAAARQDLFESVQAYVPSRADLSVVVLTSNSTASAGEVVAVAFSGRPQTRFIGGVTHGIPTGVAGFRMADGAVLRLAVSTFADRSGVVHTGNIVPDDIVADTPAQRSDAALDAAIEWLETRPGCS